MEAPPGSPTAEGPLRLRLAAAETEARTARALLELREHQQRAIGELGQAALSGRPIPALVEQGLHAAAGALQATAAAFAEVLGGRPHPVAALRPDGRVVRVPDEVDVPGGPDALAAACGTGLVQAGSGPPVAVVPVRRAGEIVALLSVELRPPGTLSDRDVAFLEQVAQILTAASGRRRAEQHVRHQASHDELTGLPNRQLLRERLDVAIAVSAARAEHAGLLLLDVDGFKDVNDALGHGTGDLVLAQIADRLRGVVAEPHTVARLGGDEFAVCLSGVDGPEAVLAVAREVHDELRRPLQLGQLDLPLSASVGVAVAPQHGTDGSTLMRHADVAMYRAKAGGEGVAAYDAGVDALRVQRLAVVVALRGAIERRELATAFQPIVDLASGLPVGLEALVRWRDAQGEPVSPEHFVGLAEQSGQIGPLTELVLDDALRTARALAAEGRPLPVAVNLSAVALADPVVRGRLHERVVAARGLLTIEITESSLVDATARRAVCELAAAGVRCAIDDFGTGWSSMAMLKELPVRRLKIDRSFVAEVHEDPRDRAIVRSLVELAAALGMEVVAEGVEEEAGARVLRDVGVGLAQGWRWAKALPPHHLRSWLSAHGLPPRTG